MDLQQIKKNFTPEEILSGGFGLEREGLRVNPDGTLAQTDHPKIFGDKMKNPYITTDFSESQVEVVTPRYDHLTRTYAVLEGLCDIINQEIGPNEYLWPGSMPCVSPPDDEIRVAHYSDEDGELGKSYEDYRKYLIGKYGSKKQLLTGIHFNFSLSDATILKLKKLMAPDQDLKEFKNDIYLKIARGYLKYRWLVIYLTGCSSACHTSYNCVKNYPMRPVEHDSLISENGVSYRNSACGYKNQMDLFPRWDSVEDYVCDVQEFIDEGVIIGAKELYTQIRLKTKSKDKVLEELLENGIEYLEVRTVDLNLFDKTGVALVDLRFIQLLLLYALFSDIVFDDNWQEESLTNELRIASYGLKPDLTLIKDQKEVDMRTWALSFIEDMRSFSDTLGLGADDVLDEMAVRIKDPSKTYAACVRSLVTRDGYIDAMMKFARAYKQDSDNFRYLFRGFENYELSTQILLKEAITRGVTVNELDPKDNFVRLEKDGHAELVKQSTKTARDNYASVLAMENKVVTKKILMEAGIPVPDGSEFTSIEDARARVSLYENRPVVIKPKSTNFGTGIFIFKHGACEADLLAAVTEAFKFDDTVLIEDYIPGEEFRFLVIDGELAAVLKRVPANVQGDGKSTIKELIDQKNHHPLRGEHYTAPLEKIVIDPQTIQYLKEQGLNPDSVIPDGEIVFLRGNSNISTGGDSVDMTDKMPENFKRVAEKAAMAADAVFCGVDMMIEDYQNPDSLYGIIELNFNPMMSMHAYPYQGKERRTGAYTLRALGFIDETLSEIDAETHQPKKPEADK